MRSLLFSLFLIASLAIGLASAFAQDERNDPDIVDAPAGDDSRSEDEAPGDSGDDASGGGEFADIVAEIRDTDPVFGPESGDLVFDSDGVGIAFPGDEYGDFLLDVTYIQPDLPATEVFDYGIAFRVHGSVDDPEFIQFWFDSNGSWGLLAGAASQFVDGTAEALDSGIIRNYDDRVGAEHMITLLAEGDSVRFGYGDVEFASVEVPYDETGFIMITAANYLDAGDAPDPVEYRDLTIWDLSGIN